MFKFRYSAVAVFLAFTALSFSQILDFSKKSNYFLGEGEFGSIRLDLKNHETFDYQSEIKKPFVLKKVNNAGRIELIYDTRTLSADEMENGKTYKATFIFVKKNIGKKEYVNVSAVLKPELRILVNDSIPKDFVNLNFTPAKKTFTLKIESLKDFEKINADIPDGVVSFGGSGNISFAKGLNELTVTLAKEANFNEEVSLYRQASEGKLNELYILVNSSGFKDTAVVSSSDGTNEEAMADSIDTMNLYADIDASTEETSDVYEEEQGKGGFGIMSIVIISVLCLIILLLLFALLKNKKSGLYEKYETFFDDVATLVKVNIKGTNIDKSIEEIMMILLDKFEYTGQAQNEEPKQDMKKSLKKPANLKSPAVVKKEDDIAADLDFGDKSIEIKPVEKKIEPAEQKPQQSGDKKISRGFDFLDD
jgi:hypothetical protein